MNVMELLFHAVEESCSCPTISLSVLTLGTHDRILIAVNYSNYLFANIL